MGQLRKTAVKKVTLGKQNRKEKGGNMGKLKKKKRNRARIVLKRRKKKRERGKIVKMI